MRSAEGRKEIVECVLVRDIDGGKPQAPSALIASEEIVVADGGVEQAARRDARRVLVVVFGVGSRDADQLGSELLRPDMESARVCSALPSRHRRQSRLRNSWSAVSPLRSIAGCPLRVVDVPVQSVFTPMTL